MNKILFVDEDDSIRSLYEEEFSEEGYEVVTHSDGSTLLEFIEQESPDVVVMAVRLGRDNGLDLLVDIRNAYYNLPVILCTSNLYFKYDLRSIAADYYVVKSSSLNELKEKIKMCIDGCSTLILSHSKIYEKGTIATEQIRSNC